MSNELKNCPKCNSNAVDFVRDESGMWHLKCFRCGFTHIACLSRRQAIQVWNEAVRVSDMKTVNVIQCKECKHFQKNSWANFDGIPLIVAHEICTFWGNGCKTNPEGYCFAGELKEVKS